MMGINVREFAPLVNVSVEELVPKDHFYRHLDRTLDIGFVREVVQPCYAAGGRSSVDPVVFFRFHARFGLALPPGYIQYRACHAV